MALLLRKPPRPPAALRRLASEASLDRPPGAGGLSGALAPLAAAAWRLTRLWLLAKGCAICSQSEGVEMQPVRGLVSD